MMMCCIGLMARLAGGRPPSRATARNIRATAKESDLYVLVSGFLTALLRTHEFALLTPFKVAHIPEEYSLLILKGGRARNGILSRLFSTDDRSLGFN
jgi:hypothetical protein